MKSNIALMISGSLTLLAEIAYAFVGTELALFLIALALPFTLPMLANMCRPVENKSPEREMPINLSLILG